MLDFDNGTMWSCDRSACDEVKSAGWSGAGLGCEEAWHDHHSPVTFSCTSIDV
jgi:hypothetical protein